VHRKQDAFEPELLNIHTGVPFGGGGGGDELVNEEEEEKS